MKTQILQKKTQSSYNIILIEHIIESRIIINLRTQNIILYIIYNIIIRIIINLRIRDQGFINPRLGLNKIFESLNQIY